MKCIDFDKKFDYYLKAWAKEHVKDFHTFDEMEAAVPGVYDTFLDTPADWLAGKKPGEYFEQFDSAKQLTDWMEDYEKQHVPVPDMLLNRLTDLGLASEAPLMNLLLKERAPQAAKMEAISILNEIESTAPVDLYISWVQKGDKYDELADSALDSLQALGDKVTDQLVDGLENASDNGKISLLTLIAPFRQDEWLVDLTLRLLADYPMESPALANILSDLGHEKAIEPLKKLAASEETGYLDYIELRNAIEALGGEAPERVFAEDDPEYTSMRALEEKLLKHNAEKPEKFGFEEDECEDCGCEEHHEHCTCKEHSDL